MNTNSSIVLHLDSRFATRQLDTGKTTNYIYDLVQSISVPNHEAVRGLALHRHHPVLVL